ncbi:MAG TPA: hypothetical protein VGM87_15730 [Roseomonas sp.]|jgi:hypothetical protein
MPRPILPILSVLVFCAAPSLLAAGPPDPAPGTYGSWQDAHCARSEDDPDQWVCRPPQELLGAVIARRPDGGARVRVQLWGADRGCQFDGDGEWQGTSLIARESPTGTGAACEIRMSRGAGGLDIAARDVAACGCGDWINMQGLPPISAATAIPPVAPRRR